jgi:hypothetical protein
MFDTLQPIAAVYRAVTAANVTLGLAATQTNSQDDRKRAKITARMGEWAEARRFL